MKPFPINSLIRHLNIDMMIRQRPSLLHFSSISILLVLEISLQACNFPGYAERYSAPTPTPAIPATPAPFQEALVVFEVQVPEDSPPNEPVYLSVLDEVTGLALNNERHEMESDGENRYSLSLPFRVGSVIKYRYARQGTYLAEEHTTDPVTDVPDHDLLCAGFPCQAFSIAGKRRGFDDTRGTLFFDVARILKEKQPRLCLLENVKGLLCHDSGRTFKTILSTLDELGYDLQWQVLNSKNFGFPQNRERVFIIGHLRGTYRPEVFPITEDGGENNGLPSHIKNTITAR